MINEAAEEKYHKISISKKSIFEKIDSTSDLWLYKDELEYLLQNHLIDSSFTGLPLRTRSKEIKKEVCKALGYEAPISFKKTQPRFLCQNFDIYSQKSRNLQIWNEDVDPLRRYVFIILNDADVVVNVFVFLGAEISFFDTTGTTTQKYQARYVYSENNIECFSSSDTEGIKKIASMNNPDLEKTSPIHYPSKKYLLPLAELFERLSRLVGHTFDDLGADQERSRGSILHKLVCERLGYLEYLDNGSFPDILNQMLEVKLQTSPTIDLGLVCPDDTSYLDLPLINGDIKVRHCDVRYAIFYGKITNKKIELTHFTLITGSDFFKRFKKFQGKVVNKKIQMRLPAWMFK
jgi:hypothetical protein